MSGLIPKRSDIDFNLRVAQGKVPGYTFIHKFGNAPDYDQSTGFVTVWDGADDGTAWESNVYTYSGTANIRYVSSDNAGDGFDLEIQGLDSSYDLMTQTVTLNGTTRVDFGADAEDRFIRVFRMKNVGAAPNLGHIFCGVGAVGGVTPGVPDVATQNRALIHPLNNQTLMSIYTVPNGKTAYMDNFYLSAHGASRDSTYDLHLIAKELDGVFQLKHSSSASDLATSHWAHKYKVPEVFAAKTDIEIRVNALGTAVTAASVSAGFDLILVDD